KLLPKSGALWQKGRIEKFLKNPYYCGRFEYPRGSGNVYDGSHEQYFSVERFNDRLARLSANRNGSLSGRRAHLLSRFVRCSECNRAWIAELQQGERKSGEYVYYKHRCRGEKKEHRFKEEDILLRTNEAVEAMRFSGSFAANLKELFRRPLEQGLRNNKRELQALASQIEKLQQKKSKLIDLFTEDGIDKTELVAKRNECELQIQTIKRNLNALIQDDRNVFDKITAAIDLAYELPERFFSEKEAASKITVLKTMAGGLVLSHDDGRLWIDWARPYSLLLRPELELAIQQESIESLKTSPAQEDSSISTVYVPRRGLEPPQDCSH
ncbi:MAG: recombinase family protein, partial [Spirochaetia bacterium]|nr:recombinase family protein [Spirochaetia bacterium]